MTPAKLDLTIYQGSTFRKGFQWKIQSTDIPMDLTGCTIKMQFRASACAEDAVLECSTANGRIILSDATNGKWQVGLSATDTAALPTGRLLYDLDITFPGLDVFTVISGVVKINAGITV